ncbi:neuropeptide S [Protopterus annectens]|uniref:neuropeptide S n=1 Tax=Protopterus annectens TaxID=7888 RepID=UPI001CFBB8D6|nr:neuropeptide S [Protopterus annectens]XP_043911611.1 neuropeptide S [Protopterus annectens]
MFCLFRANLSFLLWISIVNIWVFPRISCMLSEKSDYCLVMLNNCLAEVERTEELAFLKPFLEKSFIKRSFRNGVGSGIKKTSSRRAKS